MKSLGPEWTWFLPRKHKLELNTKKEQIRIEDKTSPFFRLAAFENGISGFHSQQLILLLPEKE